MKLLAPVRSPDEVLPLIRAGGEEIYCGLVPAAWLTHAKDDLWLNRRDPASANLHGLGELQAVVRDAHAHDVPVFLTLNAHHYAPEQLPFILEMARRVADVGVEALIVADIGLALAVREANVPVKLHLSSLATCTNADAAVFFGELGIDRVILPRHLSTREIRQLHDRAPQVEIEAFLLNDGCAYEEGRCLTSHAFGPICMTPWSVEYQPTPGAGTDRRAAWEANYESYQRYLWHLNNCGSSLTAKGLPNGPCGLCALPDLAAAGVASLKIVGREASPMRKLASVQLARAVVDRLRAGAAAEAVATRARELRATPELCDATFMCYYR
jgi:U32 family peptidase